MFSPNGISAVIITKDEEKNIERCLKSLLGIADEIIVIDSFSTDQTEAICKRYSARFFLHEWKGYTDTKNYGNSLATFDYILSIDADEALSDTLKTELIELKNQGFKSDAYKINRLTRYCGKWIYHCGWYPDYLIRLWKKGSGQWKGIIHEEVELQPGMITGKLKGHLLHYSYYSINEHLKQMMRFTDLMAEDIVTKGKKVSTIKLMLSPLVKFVKSYFIRGGFRDGFYGLVICILSSMATFIKYAKARQKLKME
jgi:glycosyltransferase involved in cell wall biosynthesis